MFVKFTMLFLAVTFLFFEASSNCVFAAHMQRAGQVVTYSRVRGWEASLVQGNPNLARFYWEPMTRRTINTTATTGHQTKHVPLPVVIHSNRVQIPSPANSSSLSYSTGATARRLSSGFGSTSDTALTYKENSRVVVVDNHQGLDVHGQLVSSKTSAKFAPKRALIAHQLSLGDTFGKQ